jgi:hypothetical protein
MYVHVGTYIPCPPGQVLYLVKSFCRNCALHWLLYSAVTDYLPGYTLREEEMPKKYAKHHREMFIAVLFLFMNVNTESSAEAAQAADCPDDLSDITNSTKD